MVDPQSFFHEITLSPKAAGFSVMESGSSFLCRDPETHRKSQLQLEVRPKKTSLISSVTTSSQQGQNAAHHGGRRAASRTVHGRKTHPTNTVLGGIWIIWENLVMRCCALLPLFCFSSSQTYPKKNIGSPQIGIIDEMKAFMPCPKNK